MSWLLKHSHTLKSNINLGYLISPRLIHIWEWNFKLKSQLKTNTKFACYDKINYHTFESLNSNKSKTKQILMIKKIKWSRLIYINLKILNPNHSLDKVEWQFESVSCIFYWQFSYI